MLYPLKFTPLLKERIWGGTALKDNYGKQAPDGKKIGESWELSGVEGDISVVSEGKLKGNNLQELIEVYMGELVGEKVYAKFGLEFPLLIKLIDAQDVLSIQVHPDDELAAERHNSYGKTEMWYVVDCQPGASLYVGFKKKTSKEEYLAAVAAGTLPSLLNEVIVKPGDAYFIPAGTIHAIGKGLLVAEIQQTSDITYRVDDWGRVDDNGNPRQLHTELAIDAIDFETLPKLNVTVAPKAGEVVEMVECQYFTTNIVEVKGELIREYEKLDSFVIYICLEGEFEVECSEGSATLKKGECMLIPAQENSVSLKGNGQLLETYIK